MSDNISIVKIVYQLQNQGLQYTAGYWEQYASKLEKEIKEDEEIERNYIADRISSYQNRLESMLDINDKEIKNAVSYLTKYQDKAKNYCSPYV